MLSRYTSVLAFQFLNICFLISNSKCLSAYSVFYPFSTFTFSHSLSSIFFFFLIFTPIQFLSIPASLSFIQWPSTFMNFSLPFLFFIFSSSISHFYSRPIFFFNLIFFFVALNSFLLFTHLSFWRFSSTI